MKQYVIHTSELDDLKRRLLDIERSVRDPGPMDPVEAVQRRITYVFETWKREMLP